MIFQPEQKLLFIGDSITDCGRQYEHAPLGNGYVYQVHLWLSAAQPQLRLEMVNRGVSGDTIRDLARRWTVDALRPQPDWLFVMIGVNDVWRQVAGLLREAVSLTEYEATYRRLIEQLPRPGQGGLVLLEPFLVEPDATHPFRRQLDHYRTAVRRLASEYGALLVQTQAAFDRALNHRPSSHWAEDGVHPTPIGHTVIAHALLQTCGCLCHEDSDQSPIK
jgi:lysophospholipase L1-like esterase